MDYTFQIITARFKPESPDDTRNNETTEKEIPVWFLGLDGITNEMINMVPRFCLVRYRTSCLTIMYWIVDHFQNSGILVQSLPFIKKGNGDSPSNYRGITLSSSSYQIMSLTHPCRSGVLRTLKGWIMHLNHLEMNHYHYIISILAALARTWISWMNFNTALTENLIFCASVKVNSMKKQLIILT